MSKTELRTGNGRPDLYIDGKQTVPVLYGLSDIPGSNSNTAYAARNIARFSRAGIHLVSVDTGLHLGWHKISEFDPSAMIAELSGALDANPNAKLLMRLHMNPPYWWLRDNPNECVIYRTPEGDRPGVDDGESDRLIRCDADEHMRVSLASRKWLDEASEKLRLLCRALRMSPAGRSLIGIQVACGINGEWHQWGIDVSRPMRERFKSFLIDKYHSVAYLREAYNDDAVSFETVPFHPETFRPGDEGSLRDPVRSRFVIDSQECIQATPPDAILRFCHVIKTELPEILTGAFYGYYLGTGKDNMTIGGHLQIRRLYASCDIDFLCGPFCYMENRKPDGVPMQRGLLESSRLRSKLWLTEMDQHPDCVPRLGGELSLKNQTVATLRRNVIQPLAAGHGLWYYDHRVIPLFVAEHPELAAASSIYNKFGWWEDEYLMREIESLQQLAGRMTAEAYKSAADLLLVYDTDSYYVRAQVYEPEYKIHEVFARCGAVFDCIYSDELESADLDRYKCIVFVNLIMQTPERRERIAYLTRGRKTVSFWACGYCDGKQLSISALSEAVGINLKKIQGAQYICYVDGEIPIPETGCLPLFAVDDVSAEPLAYYDNGQVAAARKGDNFWYAVSPLTHGAAVALLEECGVHRYTDSGDPVIAGGGIAAINCVDGGRRVLTLRNGISIECELEPYTTAVFDDESGERLL